MTPDELKVAICDCLIDINNEIDPVTRDKWGPIIPPTSIDWIGDRLVVVVMAVQEARPPQPNQPRRTQ